VCVRVCVSAFSVEWSVSALSFFSGRLVTFEAASCQPSYGENGLDGQS